MATKKIELELANAGKGCLGKAADDEPVFILRAQDELAPPAVEMWAEGLAVRRGNDDPKVREARALAHMMRAWQQLNHRKVPD